MINLLVDLVRSKHFKCCGEIGRCGKCLSRFITDIINPIELANGSEPLKSGDYGLYNFGPYTFYNPKNFMSVGKRAEHLANELLSLPIEEFIKLEDWAEIMRMAFYGLPDKDLRSLILRKWLIAVGSNIRVTDVLLFYILRKEPIDPDVYEAWIQKAIDLAKQSRDISLVESLILTINSSISKYRSLLDLATELSQKSLAIQKALNRSHAMPSFSAQRD